MGRRPAPSYANLFMTKKIDPLISELAAKYENVNPLAFFKRFLDDIFLIYTGSLTNLHNFLSELNNIKFTMTHTTPSGIENPECGCPPSETLAFLDTSCRLVEGTILTDLYTARKLTETSTFFRAHATQLTLQRTSHTH